MKFTYHASKRLFQRCSLDRREVLSLLKSRSYPLGNDKHRLHKLFYSQPDDECFIAVQDENTDEIITILPVDYHSKWKVDLSILEKVKNDLLGDTYIEPVQKNLPFNITLNYKQFYKNSLGKILSTVTQVTVLNCDTQDLLDWGATRNDESSLTLEDIINDCRGSVGEKINSMIDNFVSNYNPPYVPNATDIVMNIYFKYNGKTVKYTGWSKNIQLC